MNSIFQRIIDTAAGFKNFLMRGDIIVVAIGLVVALGFSNLIKSFTDSIVNPIIDALQSTAGTKELTLGLGWQLGEAGNKATFVDVGAFISAVIYFLVLMATIYFVIVLPFKHVSAKRGISVFETAPTKSCPSCKSDGLNLEATRCKYCTSPIE